MLNQNFSVQEEVGAGLGSLLERIDQIELEKSMPESPLSITELNGDDPFIIELRKAYDSEESFSLVRRVVISILCYMRTRNKVAFAISYKRMQLIYQTDPNWKSHTRFEKGTFVGVCSILSGLGVQRIVKHSGYRPGIVYADENSHIAKYLTAKPEEQLFDLFKTFKTTEDDFVDEEIKEKFKVLLIQ
jgi:hypothetical protein